MQLKWRITSQRWHSKPRADKPRAVGCEGHFRVAYDVSFPASRLTLRDRKLGIIRTIEETFLELIAADPTVFAAVGLRGNDIEPALTSGRAKVYQQLVLNSRIPHVPTYKSRTGLGHRYEARFVNQLLADLRCASERRDAPPPIGSNHEAGPKVLRKAARTAVRSLIQLDTTVELPRAFDIFHATYFPLPPRQMTGTARRVMTVYDLIPLLNPEIVPAPWCEHFRKAILSLDTQRDWAICISEHTKADLCRVTGMSPSRIFVTPQAADHHFRPIEDSKTLAAVRQKYAIPQQDYLLTICTPQPRKNLSFLIRSFIALVQAHREIRTNLVLAGVRTPELDALQDEISRTGNDELPSRILFTGYVDDDDLPALYSAAKAFVFPSLSEGFGLPPLEAMKCGLPVICSNAASLPEVVGDAALLIDPRDQAQLVSAMDLLLTTPELAADLREQGLRRAAEFSWAATARKTMDAYKEIMRA